MTQGEHILLKPLRISATWTLNRYQNIGRLLKLYVHEVSFIVNPNKSIFNKSSSSLCDRAGDLLPIIKQMRLGNFYKTFQVHESMF